MAVKYSVVIPIKDEQESITDLLQEIEPVMDSMGEPWECICVDDGSTDRTPEILKDLAETKAFIRVLTFARNYGQSSAFDAGFREARGEIVLTLDADGQNDPADIPKLLEKMQESDLVCGVRQNRRDPLSKRWISKLANYVRSRVCQDGMQDTGCSLKAYRKSCLNRVKLYHGMHRFLPALFRIEGFRIAEVPVNHRPRAKGKSKYHFLNRSLSPLMDMFAVLWMRKRHLRYRIARRLP